MVNQWLQVQVTCSLPGALERVRQLMQHPAFDIKNPNKVRAVIGAFAAQNAVNFHQLDGEGYRFLADQVIVLNRLESANRLAPAGAVVEMAEISGAVQARMIAELRRIAAEPDLSSDVYEDCREEPWRRRRTAVKMRR